MKTVHTEIHTQTFTAALFKTVKRYKQLTCPSNDEWRNKLCCNRIIKLYLAIKHHCAEGKQPDTKGHIHESIYIKSMEVDSANPEPQRVDGGSRDRGRGGTEHVSWDDEMSKISWHSAIKLPKATELYTLTGSTLWYVNCI